jgi:homoserine kinase type II
MAQPHPTAASSPAPVDPASSRAGQTDTGMSASVPGGLSADVPSAVGGGKFGKAGRQTFAAHELAIVLSHYDLGPLESLWEFPRGSRKAPKIVVQNTRQEMYLLKRRARGRDDAEKVAFCHGIQMHLADRQFPLPHLIGTRKDNNSMLKLDDSIYELFEYIQGNSYDNSLEATTEAGRVLALFHKLLADHQPRFKPSRGSYHASRSVAKSSNAIPSTLQQTEPEADRQEVGRVVQFLGQSYQAAAAACEAEGLGKWPRHIAHADWHPGNMLFRGKRVVAVIDYDAARLQPRVVDAANGALQFSIIGGGSDDVDSWPDYLDESRFKRFLRGYDSVPSAVLSRAELRVVPHLMIEALIAESVIPIAATGYFAKMPGGRFLPMVERKVRWLQDNAQKLIDMVEG